MGNTMKRSDVGFKPVIQNLNKKFFEIPKNLGRKKNGQKTRIRGKTSSDEKKDPSLTDPEVLSWI